MKPIRHVVIFARAPALGRVKRRLGRDIGVVGAWRFYLKTARRVIGVLGRDPRWRTWVALTPDGEAKSLNLGAVEILPQGQGDLGLRMARPIRTLPPGAVVVVGTDIPDLDAGHIWRAFRALDRGDLVFGPATDGGFWLVGACARARNLSLIRPRLFRGVRWSTPNALDDTLANIRPGQTVAWGDTLGDVDTGADYAAAKRRREKP